MPSVCRRCGRKSKIGGPKFWWPGVLMFANYASIKVDGRWRKVRDEDIQPICDPCKEETKYLAATKEDIWR